MEIRRGRKLPNVAIGFELWWRGFPVPAARSHIAAILDSHSDASLEGDPYDIADRVEEELRAKPPTGALYPLLVDRVEGDADALISGLYALTLLMLRETPALDSTAAIAGADDRDEMIPAEALERLLGFARAAQDEAPDGSKLIDEPVDIAALFDQLLDGGSVDLRDLSATLESASDQELELAREDAHAFVYDFSELARSAERAYGPDFAGFGIFALSRPEKEERFFRAGSVLMLLVIRRALGGHGIEEIKKQLRMNAQQARAYNAITDAFPEYADYFRLDQVEKLRDAPSELVESMRSEVSAFVAANPEIDAALRDADKQ